MRALPFDSVSEGDELPTKSYAATRGDLVYYAGVVGDPNPIHYSDAVADYMGLQDVCSHGMFSMGIGATYITEWLGDPTAIKTYNTRFTSPWYVPATRPGVVEFSGKIKSLNPEDKTGVIVVNAKQDDRRIFGKTTFTVQFS